VSLDAGTIVTVAGKDVATCTDDNGEPTGESREGFQVSPQPGRFDYGVWPPLAGSLIRRVNHSPPDSQPAHVPARELEAVSKLVHRYARGEIDVLQRFEGDVDADGQTDIVYSVDVRCTKSEMRAQTAHADGEPWSCFNGLLVRWGGSTTFTVVAKDWDLGQIVATFDFAGDGHSAVLVFAPLDEGFRIQAFSVNKRKLSPLESWCCGCRKKHEKGCCPTRR